MGRALRILLTLVLVLAVGLSACGRRGSLARPRPSYPEAQADPSTKMSRAAARSLCIHPLIQSTDTFSMYHLAYRRGVSKANVLHAEEVDLTDLAAAVGTPFYCYST